MVLLDLYPFWSSCLNIGFSSMCHLLPPQSQHSPGGFGCNLCDRWALPMETQVFSAHQPRLEFAPNCAAWTCGNVWKSYLPTKKINMASGSKHMTWVWSLETVYSLPSTTVSHQCLAVLAAWVSLGRSKRNWRSAAMTRHSNASNWTSQIFQCHHLRYVAFFAHFLNWFLLLIGHPAEVWSDWSMLSFGVCGEMVPTCTNWVLIFTNSKACLWAESLSRWDTWDGPCPGLGKLEETGTIWLHTFSVPMGSYGYLWVLSWQSTHRKTRPPGYLQPLSSFGRSSTFTSRLVGMNPASTMRCRTANFSLQRLLDKALSWNADCRKSLI